MKILAVAGSSGGHIFPALALLERIRKDHSGADILLVLPKSIVARNIGVSGLNVAYIDSANLSSRLDSRSLIAGFKFLKGSLQSLVIFLRFKPDAVVGFGSITSIPLVLLGWLMRIKTILHEQNVVPGKANRFLSRFCDRIAVSFEQTRQYLPGKADKICFTGNPLRKGLIRLDKEECRRFFCFPPGADFTLLVAGGSQGSARINRGVVEALSGFAARDKIRVIHLAGSQEQSGLQQEYSRIGVKARVFSFLNEMEYALSLADLAICRAGATGIQELMHYRLPAILVPYPFAEQHQMANARVLESKGAARILEDKGALEGKLRTLLSEILGDQAVLERMRSGFGFLENRDAAEELCRLVVDCRGGHA